MAFPNFTNKHSEDPMFSPEGNMAYRKKRGTHPRVEPPVGAIFCYQSRLMNHILENHEATGLAHFMGEVHLLKETGNSVAVAGRFGVGAPAAVLLLEELIAFGVRYFVAIGTAGALQKGMRVGDLVVCDRAIRDEGTSHHYLAHSRYAHASPGMTKRLSEALEKLNQKYSIGTSWTIDAPFRETVAEARRYQEEGVATVDMESSALFAVARLRSVQIGAAFVVSDSLAELVWQPGFHFKKLTRGLEVLYRAALDTLVTLVPAPTSRTATSASQE